MGFVRRDTGTVIAAVLVAVALVLVIGPGFTEPASAGETPCSRYGDKRPTELEHKARNAVICFINREREERGRGRLDRDSRLVTAARRHSEKMRDKGCFSHQCRGEVSVLQRLKNVNYIVGGLSRWAYGENIAWGTGSYGTPRQTVNAWMRSSGHRANILSGTFRDVGVGFAERNGKGYYTADFGLRAG